MAGIARQRHMGRVPLAPSFLLLIFLFSALRPSEVRIFRFLDVFHSFSFVEYLVFESDGPLFPSVESRKPPHRPTAAQTAFHWGRVSSGNLKIGHRGNTGFTQGSRVLSASPFTPDPGDRAARNARDAKTTGPIPASLAALASLARRTAPPPAAVRYCGSCGRSHPTPEAVLSSSSSAASTFLVPLPCWRRF